MNDKISVIMATYNCEKTVEKAIDSILAQTYENWVTIICDDGSADGTLEILRRYEREHPGKFVIIQNEENKKLPYSLNHCLQYVQTDLVARMDGDDWSAPDRFEKQVAFLKEHPEYDLVGTGVTVFDGEKKIPVTGISMSGKLSEVLNSIRLSEKTVAKDNYKGPAIALLKNLSII